MTLASPELWPHAWPVLPVALLVAVGAGAVRGFAGFGFAALVVGGLSPFVPPGPVVLAVMLLEVLASLGLLRALAPDVDRSWLRVLLLGNGLCIPLGMTALAWLPVVWVRILVGAALLVASLALRRVVGRGVRSGRGLRGLAGVASGLLNGLAASGGVVAAMLMATTRIEPVAMRATMITFLFWVSLYAVAWALGLTLAGSSTTRLVGWDTLRWMLVLGPAMLLGMRLGTRAFGSAHPQQYRRFVLNLLVVISALGLTHALWTLSRS